MCEEQVFVTRDQKRAIHAYQCVREVGRPQMEEYKIAVNDLGSHILRSGLAATMAYLEREREREAIKLVLRHLAGAAVPGLETVRRPEEIPEKVRGMKLDEYLLATRELLKVLVWFKRAVQAASVTLTQEVPNA